MRAVRPDVKPFGVVMVSFFLGKQSRSPTGDSGRNLRTPAANDPVVAVGFGITVTARDRPELYLAGKGGISCETGRFYAYFGG